MKNEEIFYYLPADVLARHIDRVQHQDILLMLKEMEADLQYLKDYYGQQEKKLHHDFLRLFAVIRAHFAKEAISIFPIVRRYATALKQRYSIGRGVAMNSVCYPVNKMYNEHKMVMRRIELILQHLRHGVKKNSVEGVALYEKMDQLKVMWGDQTAIENDILFPKLIEMESILDPLNP